jgi:hypothetical protein
MTTIQYSPLVLLFIATAAWAGDEDAALDRPSFAASQSMAITAVVEEINHENRVVTVRNPDNLHRAIVGDLVVINFTEAVAAVVEKQAPVPE